MLEDMVIDGIDVAEDGPGSVDRVGRLLQRVAEGDRGAFTRVYDILSPRAFGLIRQVVIDRGQSEQVLHEVFLELWQTAGRFRPSRGDGTTWVLAITHRRAVDQVRASPARTDRDIRGDLAAVIGASAELRGEGRRVAAALAELPNEQRETLVLSYFGGCSQSEIAALTGASLGRIKARMRDGLSQLRKHLGTPS